MRINARAITSSINEKITNSTTRLNKSIEKLGTGRAVNAASDNAAGLAIADKLRLEATSVKQAVTNGNQALTMTQLADKAMDEISNLIDVIKQKVIQSQTATTSTSGKDEIETDIKKLLDQIDNIVDQTNYNGTKLLDTDKTLTFLMGETKDDVIQVDFSDVSSSALGIDGVTGKNDDDIDKLDSALETLSKARGKVAAGSNQFESSIRNLLTQYTNVKNSESVIRDVDYLNETSNFNKENIISQSGTYALSQANRLISDITKVLQ